VARKEQRRAVFDGPTEFGRKSSGAIQVNYGKIVVMDAKPGRKAAKWVLKCVTANVCLCGCGKQQFKRGLSQNCYYAWRSTRERLGEAEKQAAYDARLIRGGRLLVAGGAQQIKKQTVFSQAAAEVAS
jgi:hypothetical protein